MILNQETWAAATHLIRVPATRFDFAMPNTETLDQIRKGQSVHVTDVVGDDPIARRLNDLGIREGVRIEVIRRAPLGDPTLFELCGYQLCLRRTESARVRVLPVSATADATPQSMPGRRARDGDA